MKTSTFFRISLVILGSFLITAQARAGGFATARFGGEFGHPATDHPTAIYFNPAGLALGSGTRLYIGGLFVYRSASYDRPEAAIDNVRPDGDLGSGTPEIAVSANSGKAKLGNFLASPFLGVVSDLGVDNLGVGAAFYVPFGGSANWDQNLDYVGDQMFPGAQDGVQRWSNIEGTQRSLYITAAGAYRIPAARVSVGIGLNYIINEIDTIRARTAAGTDDLIAGTDTQIEGRSLVKVDGSLFSVGGGITYQPIDALVIGASYQSQPGFGEHGLEGTLTNKFGNGPTTVSDVELRQALPDIFRLGLRYRPTPLVEVRVSGDYTRWSVFEKQCLIDLNDPDRNCALTPEGAVDNAGGGSGIVQNVPRDWKDTFGVRLGGSYWLQPALEVFAGAAYDSNAVPDDTIDAALMDMDKLIGTLGLRYGILRNKLDVMASLTYVAYLARTIDERAVDPLPPSRNPDGAGKYDQDIGLLTVGVGYKF